MFWQGTVVGYRISGLIGLKIYINLPFPEGIVGLLPYTMLKEELDEMLKEETIETADKDETIETADKDETQVDFGGN